MLWRFNRYIPNVVGRAISTFMDTTAMTLQQVFAYITRTYVDDSIQVGKLPSVNMVADSQLSYHMRNLNDGQKETFKTIYSLPTTFGIYLLNLHNILDGISFLNVVSHISISILISLYNVEGGSVQVLPVIGSEQSLYNMSVKACKHIKAWIQNGYKPSDIAVLSRNNRHLTILNSMLLMNGIYCNCTEDMKVTKGSSPINVNLAFNFVLSLGSTIIALMISNCNLLTSCASSI